MSQHLSQMVRERAKLYANRDVFWYKEEEEKEYKKLSWNNLIKMTDKVSKALLSLGFGRETKIGIFSNNCVKWTISDLGILSTRGVVVPFFGTASKHQVKYIVDETQMQFMFVGNKDQLEKALWVVENSDSLEKIVVFDKTVSVDNDHCMSWTEFCNLGDDPKYDSTLNQLIKEAKTNDLATIIYTSGTTGEPKGVMLDHNNFLRSFKSHDLRLDIRESDVSLCFLPLSHIFERAWTFYLLHCGAVNCFLSNPKKVVDVLPVVKPTVMCTVPRFYEKTYDAIMTEKEKWPAIKQNVFNWAIKIGRNCTKYQKDAKRIPFFLNIKHFIADKLVFKTIRNIFGGNIRFLPCAGAAIRPELLKFFHAADVFVNYGYGATETTATVSCARPDVFNLDTCGSIMPDVSVKISDEGEIMIKGDTVFKGYYNKPEETAKSLQNGWYKSGDEGFITNEGYLVMTDRIKDLMKTSGGKYVSPQKIELMLSEDPFIEQIIVIGDSRKFISALVVPEFESLKITTKNLGIINHDAKTLVMNEKIIDFFKQRIDKLQEELSPHERIVKFTLLSEPFSIENDALTSTLKMKRKLISEQYKEIINKMYE
ncbi:MAG: long-chain fatty acid--CoA ligase [Bacteroidetes bacterium]|nr:MAG: long-chain fatty acid--CoA ligase [Bacteroidota bacterium]